MKRRFVTVGALLALLAVALGAFGTHALRSRLSPEALATWRTGMEYHLAHAIALVLTGLVAPRTPSRWVGAAGWLFSLGILLFSGSLYLLALTGVRAWGAVAPLGGASFLAGWACLAVGSARDLE